jgi:hypothetical protein
MDIGDTERECQEMEDGDEYALTYCPIESFES